MGQILRRCIILVLDEFAFLMFLFEEVKTFPTDSRFTNVTMTS